jgi:hypothetical protein
MRNGNAVLVVHLRVVEPLVVDPGDDLLAHVAHATGGCSWASSGAEAELGAVGGGVEQLGGDVGKDGGRLLQHGGVAQRLPQDVTKGEAKGESGLDAGGCCAHLGAGGQQRAEVVLEEVLHLRG